MALNLSALSTVTTAAKTIANVILATPLSNQGIQPLAITASAIQEDGAQEMAPILFDFDGEQTVDLTSDITDNYTEDNTALQDQIALRPEVIRTNGYISELNDIVPEELKFLQTATQKLLLLEAYTPGLTVAALRAYNEAVTVYAVGRLAISAAVSKWTEPGTALQAQATRAGVELSGGMQNKQQAAYLRFMGYWRERRLFKVQTPWCIFPFCAIQSVRAIQGEDTRTVSNFEVTFKTIRFARTVQSGFIDFGQGRFNNQAAPVLNNGNSTPVANIGLADQLTAAFPRSF